MSELLIFSLIFGGFFVLRGIVATVVFYFILPQDDRCPNCDAVTLRLESRRMNVFMPGLRSSWCYECDWHGYLRQGQLSPAPTPAVLSKTP
ncbi:hypothetical protein BH09GEM1_BH09GEM1_22010 [soil metagenome]